MIVDARLHHWCRKKGKRVCVVPAGCGCSCSYARPELEITMHPKVTYLIAFPSPFDPVLLSTDLQTPHHNSCRLHKILRIESVIKSGTNLLPGRIRPVTTRNLQLQIDHSCESHEAQSRLIGSSIPFGPSCLPHRNKDYLPADVRRPQPEI